MGGGLPIKLPHLCGDSGFLYLLDCLLAGGSQLYLVHGGHFYCPLLSGSDPDCLSQETRCPFTSVISKRRWALVQKIFSWMSWGSHFWMFLISIQLIGDIGCVTAIQKAI